jgi:hypothetical protein
VRRNIGAAGIDKTTLVMVEEYGVSRLLGTLARDLQDVGYRPLPARRVRPFPEIMKPEYFSHHRCFEVRTTICSFPQLTAQPF